MKKLNQQGIAHILLVGLLVIIAGVIGFAAWRVMEVDNDDVIISESGDFKRETNTVFSNVKLHNMEALLMPDGMVRAFMHEGPSGVLSAISRDGGQTFTLESGQRVQGSVPATVKLADGRWRMYYGSGEGLMSAISSDGLNFTPEEGVRLPKGGKGELDEFGITHPSVVSLPDGSFRLYYDGQFKPESGPYWRIMSASSKDGLTWTKDAGSRVPVDTMFGDFEADLAFSSHVQYENDRFVMYFSAQGNPISASGIWRATSTDGLNFQVETAPVLGRDAEFGNEEDQGTTGGPKGVPQDPYIIRVNGVERLYYWTSDKGYRSAVK